jgi:predicted secreted protein
MATEAEIGYGTIVEIENDATPAVYEKIAETKDVTLPDASVDQVEVTHNESPDRAREFVPGLIDYGDASFEMNYVAASASDVRLQELLNTGDKKNVRITSPQGSVMTFLAYVSGYSRRSPVGDARTATVNLKVSGPPTIVAAP